MSSEIAHVLFRKESGWNVSNARAWLRDRDFRVYGDPETMESEGGRKLEPGTYLIFRVVPFSQTFSSYGYGDEVGDEGVWFKFGGDRTSEDVGPAYRGVVGDDLAGRIVSIETADVQIRSCQEGTDYLHDTDEEQASIVIMDTGIVSESMALADAIEEMCALRGSDHLGPTGRYFVEFRVGADLRIAGPFSSEGAATIAADQLTAHQLEVFDVYEKDADGNRVSL